MKLANAINLNRKFGGSAAEWRDLRFLSVD
jgi:hypothetical protein